MTRRTIDVVLFEGFEVLDVFGPVELFDHVDIDVRYLGPQPGPVRSAQDVEVVATYGYAEATNPDIVLIPGGIGTRTLVADPEFLAWFTNYCDQATLVTSVCTGSGVLAAAGLLDGYRATSNKFSFAWASSNGSDVTWVPQARWVADRDRWTSSGVAAGMDMAAALIAELFDAEVAQKTADLIELDIHKDPDWDPFAAIHGLVQDSAI